MNRVLWDELSALAKALTLDVSSLVFVADAEALVDGLLTVLDLAVSRDEAWGLQTVDYASRHVLRVVQIASMATFGPSETGLYEVVRDALLIDLCRCAALRRYESQNEAQAVQLAVFAAVRQYGSDPVLYRQWQTLLRDSLEQQKTTLPHIEHHRLPGFKPALVLAYELYDDVAQEADIIRRNKVKHPGFLLPGTMLEVLSRDS